MYCGVCRSQLTASADRAEPSHIRSAGAAVGTWRLSRELLAQRAELGVPAGPGGLVGVGPLEGLVVLVVLDGLVGAAEGAGVPGGAESPVVGFSTPVGLRGHVEAERLGGGLPRPPGVGRGVMGGAVEINGQRRLPVVTVSVGRAPRAGKGGVETMWTWQRGGGTGDGSGPGESGGGGGGGRRRRSARSTGQSAVTQRDIVEALTRERRTPVRHNQKRLLETRSSF